MIKTLMEMPDIMIYNSNKGIWLLTAGKFTGEFQLYEKEKAVLLIKLNDLAPSFSLLESWQRQFSTGEFEQNMAVVRQDDCWWLGQYFDRIDTLVESINLQILIAESMCFLTERDAVSHGLKGSREPA